MFSNNEELCGRLCTLDTSLKEFLTEAISSAHSDQHEMVHIMRVVVTVSHIVSLCSPVCATMHLPQEHASSREEVARLIEEASHSDLSHLLGNKKEVRLQLLLKPLYEVCIV